MDCSQTGLCQACVSRCRVTSSARCWWRCAGLAGTRPVLGLVVGSYQGCREALHGLAREAAKAKATAKWRQMGVRSVHEALGIYTHDVHRRWGSVSWLAVVGARHPRPPARHWAAERRHPSPRPAARVRARPRGCWRGRRPRRGRRCTPASCTGHARRQACERRAAGWRAPAEPTMLRLNLQVVGL
jgi:hypothetical protein